VPVFPALASFRILFSSSQNYATQLGQIFCAVAFIMKGTEFC
jgi:hypothetical protein